MAYLPDDGSATSHDALRRVGWTRGEACAGVANALAVEAATKIEGDLRRTCVNDRIGTIVSRKMTSFDLVPTVVPQSVRLEATRRVTAAVGEGPHSPLAVRVAARLGAFLGIPCDAVSVYHSDQDRADTEARLAQLTAEAPTVETRILKGASAVELIDDLDPESLLVVGAPGGSWFQRQIYGQGHRLVVAAPTGVLMVRSAPPRCFHMSTDDSSSVVGSHMSVGDVRHLVHHAVVCVADDGILVGIVRNEDLVASPDATPVADVMELPVSVGATEPASEIAAVRTFFAGAPIPAVDSSGYIVGMIP